MRVITNVPIITEEKSNCCGMSGFDDYSNANDKKTERKSKVEQRKAKRLANKKPKKNARKLFSKKDSSGNEKFFYPLSKLFKKDGKWFKKERDGSSSEVDNKNVINPDPNFRFFNVKKDEPIAVDKTEVTKVTGGGAVNWQMALGQGLAKVKDAIDKGYLPFPVENEKVTTTDEGDFLNDEVQDKDKPLEDVKKDEKNVLTKTQKTLVWGIGIVAVGIIGYALYKYFSKGKTAN